MAIRQYRATDNTKRYGKPLPSTQLFFQNNEGQNRRDNRTNHIGERRRLQTDMVDGVNK